MPITQAHAAERVEQHLARAIEALPDQPALRIFRDHVRECPSADDAPGVRVEVSRGYWLDDLAPERSGRYVEALVAHWTGNGFRVLADARPADMFVSVENAEDGFRMSVALSADGRLSLGASSPCVRPDGAPPES